MSKFAVRYVAVCLTLVTLPVSYAAPGSDLARHASVTAVLEFDQPDSSIPLDAVAQELSRILAPTGADINIRVRNESSEVEISGELVVFKMKGWCTMNALPIGALSDERGPLAMTYSVDGQMLEFGEVNCDRVRSSLQRVFGTSYSNIQQQVYGRALARVMAHELYHMFVQSPIHSRRGITKGSLSAWELSSEDLRMSPSALHALSNALNAPLQKQVVP